MADQPLPELPPLPANPFAASAAMPTSPSRTSRLAVASLVLGILSCPFSILCGLPGLVCGIMGLNRISRSERAATSPRLSGQGMAIAGVILSGLSMLILPVMIGLMLPAVQAAREAVRRAECSNNMRQMAMSMLLHESTQQILPAAITDADGRPLLSWRVAILPYLEEQALYAEFHLDEPWDSEHNKALISRMPQAYACPSAPLDDGKTRYLLLDGPGAAFEKAKQQNRDRITGVELGGLRQGTANTILVVEAPADRAVEWTKPEELTVSPDQAAKLEDRGGGHSRGIRHAVYADGHVEMLIPDDGR
jgi:prepilin-type processing-associated H-X9-DG protein